MSTSDSTPTVVLVHGAFVDASSWNGVIAELKAAGLDVVAPPNLLRGVGVDASYLTGFDTPLAAALRTFTYTGEHGEQATDTYVDAALFHDAVCAEAPADVADTLARTQRPASLDAFTTAVTGTPAWQRLPSWAVVASAKPSWPASTGARGRPTSWPRSGQNAAGPWCPSAAT